MTIFKKFKEALSFSSSKITSGIDSIFHKKKLDQETLTEFEDLLITNDLSMSVSIEIVKQLKEQKFNENVNPAEIKLSLSKIITDILEPNNRHFILEANQLNVILICGVNGNGKTTTIGKLSNYFINQGKKVGIAACDTFRAAAVEQLESWAKKTGATFYQGSVQQDPASVAFNSVVKAKEDKLDVLFIDTAGRLQNYKNLMDELSKIVKVIKKADAEALKYSLLVIDATIGQNAYSQVEEFKSVAEINGLIITKLDGTSRAGVVVGIVQRYKLPIYFIGLGEKSEDLEKFNAQIFSENLVGLSID